MDPNGSFIGANQPLKDILINFKRDVLYKGSKNIVEHGCENSYILQNQNI